MARIRTPPPPAEVLADAFRRSRTLPSPRLTTREQLLAHLALEALEDAGYRIVRQPDHLYQRPDPPEVDGQSTDSRQDGK